MLEKRQQELEVSLFERRQMLADLYNGEMDMWRREVMSKVETQDDRKSRFVNIPLI